MPQPHYPYRFIQADALTFPLDGYDFIWTSPPCQSYTSLQALCSTKAPRLIHEVRTRLMQTDTRWCIENVPGARKEMIGFKQLCGTLFDLNFTKHRLFETNFQWSRPRLGKCNHKDGMLKTVFCSGSEAPEELELLLRRRRGHIIRPFYPMRVSLAMRIDHFMNADELSNAIPPCYSKWIVEQAFK